MRLSIADPSLRTQLTSESAARASWGVAAPRVQMCLALLDAATSLGDLLTFACLFIRVVPEGVLVTHREATVVITPVDRHGHQIQTDSTWPAGLPATLRDAQRAQITAVQLEVTVGSTLGPVR